MTLLVDDQLVAAHLRGTWQPPGSAALHTTGCWYVRLCTAVALARGGSLSGPFESLPAATRTRAVRAVLSLPPAVGLSSLRELGPLMGELATRHQLNLLSREALAAALTLGATVIMAEGNENPTLVAALDREGVRSDVVALGRGSSRQ